MIDSKALTKKCDKSPCSVVDERKYSWKTKILNHRVAHFV
jgi:hypothetical protein